MVRGMVAVLMAGVELVAGIELVELKVVLLLLDIQMVVFPILRAFGEKKGAHICMLQVQSRTWTVCTH